MEGKRSCTWVKNKPQDKGLVQKGLRKGQNRRQRPQAPYIGMMLHQDGSCYEWVPWSGTPIEDILCEQFERTVSNENCARFDGLFLQILSDKYRYHYVWVKGRVYRYPDGNPAIFHRHRKLASYNSQGKEIVNKTQKAA